MARKMRPYGARRHGPGSESRPPQKKMSAGSAHKKRKALICARTLHHAFSKNSKTEKRYKDRAVETRREYNTINA